MLQQFKAEYEKHTEYLLAPVTRRPDGQLWFDIELGIVKRTIHFYNTDEIDPVVLEMVKRISKS